MLSLRYILILVLSLILISETSFVAVSALSNEDVAINSIEELQAQSEIESQSEMHTITENQSIDVQTDISTLIAAKVEYIKSESLAKLEPQFIVNPITQEINPINNYPDIFDNFLQYTNTQFVDGQKSKKIKLSHAAYNEKKIKGTRGTIMVQISTGTTISSISGDIIDPKSINISDVSTSIRNKADEYHNRKSEKVKKGSQNSIAQSDIFEFGIPGTHLIFSNPVSITIRTPNISDGNIVDLGVLHAGDSTFNTSGLSASSDTLCGPNGSASKPSSQILVKNGKITFYTCGASSFTMNPTGGTTGSNDLRLIIGDCAQVQIYYNNLSQIYTGNPPGTGCTGPSVWPVLRIGNTSYGNTFNAWTTATTTGSTNDNIYTATSTMTAVNGGRTYTLIIDWVHIAPNKYLTWSYRVIIPTGNTQNVRFYYGMNSAISGGDSNDMGYYTNTGSQSVGVYDSVTNIISAFTYISGPTWTAYEADQYANIRTNINNGTNLSNVIQSTTGDLGFGINWDFGSGANITYSGSVEWRILPYATSSVDLIPGIGQPEGPLTTGYTSQLPITLTNAGNLTSTGVHSVVFTLPTNISGPTSISTNNAWLCGVTVGSTVTCTKTTTIASLASETLYIPVIPLPASQGTAVTFNVSISNLSDSNMTNNTAFATNSIVSGAPSNDPGGVTGEGLWLQANTGTNCIVPGCTITTWSNKGSLGTAANAITGLGMVTYDSINRINDNPTLYFNNASLNTNNNLGLPTRAISLFAVTKIANGGQFLIGTQTATTNAREWMTSPTTDQWKRYNGTIFYNGANSRTTNIPAITTTIRQTGGASAGYTNSLAVLSSTNTSTFTNNNIGIGRVANTNSTLTSLAEVIIYNSTLTAVQQNKVESYLAIKYGITLDQTTATNYTFSNGNTIWNSTSAGIYNKNIAGIGRDDTSTLNQIKSQSVDNTGDIIVSKSIIATNNRFLTWANNNDVIDTFTGSDAPTGYSRIAREWQFQEKNGDIGNVTITYPTSSLPIGATIPLYMFIDSDGTFGSGASVYTGSLVGNNWEFTVSIGDMQYVTFGQFADTIAPTITSISRASGSLMPIGNFPLNVNFSDTGSNINPSSFTGKIYKWDGISTWGTTNLAPTYMTLSGLATTTNGNLIVSGLPFGKYRFDISVADNAGNITTQSVIYYIDAIEWSVSADTYDIGMLMPNTQAFGTGEMILTVKTVGAGYSLKMVGANTLAKGADTINYWNGTIGWGYDQWNGTSYPGVIMSTGTSATLASQATSINTNGLKNTYTYRIKYGEKIGAEQAAGLYNGSVNMQLVVNY